MERGESIARNGKVLAAARMILSYSDHADIEDIASDTGLSLKAVEHAIEDLNTAKRLDGDHYGVHRVFEEDRTKY